jgi:hypothetical protein
LAEEFHAADKQSRFLQIWTAPFVVRGVRLRPPKAATLRYRT